MIPSRILNSSYLPRRNSLISGAGEIFSAAISLSRWGLKRLRLGWWRWGDKTSEIGIFFREIF